VAGHRRYRDLVLVMILSVLAVVFTTLRSWPQFVRIVIKQERSGVSALTWAMALANHTGWFVFGLVSGLPLLIGVNLLAAAGCAGTVWVLRSGRWALAVTVASATLALAAFALGETALLVIITSASLTMFVPQLLRTVHEPAAGVSPAAWAVAALASVTWLAYAWAIDRPSIVIAHLVMLPLSLLILARVWSAGVGRAPALETPSP
jgi:uncharacterized protein with PQ loop repeat